MSKPHDPKLAMTVNQLIDILTEQRDQNPTLKIGECPVVVCTHLGFRKKINFVIAAPHKVAPVALHFKDDEPIYMFSLIADEAIPCHGDSFQLGPEIHVNAVIGGKVQD